MKRILVLSALLCGSGMALAQPALNPGIETRLNFEDGKVVFQPFGDTSQISITRDAANVKEGRAAMRFDYQIGAGQINAALAVGNAGAITSIKSFRFWIKADYATTLVMVLQEQGSGRYIAMFHAPKNQWQHVELALSDFVLSQEGDDPADPNGKLDMDLVEAAALADFSQLFAQSKNEELKKLLGVKTGPHTFYLDDFWASDRILAPTPGVDAKDTTIIDAFTQPQLPWLAFGAVQLGRVTAKELEAKGAPASVRERGMVAQYRQRAGLPIGLVRRIAVGSLRGMTALKLTAATEKPLTLLVQFEEKSGGKYHTTVDLPGDGKAMDIRLATALFEKSDDSNDNNTRLDLDQVKQIVIIDPTGLLAAGEGDNQLWLSDLRIEKAAP